MRPEDIEKRSMELIALELGETDIDENNLPVIKRVIHTTADFEYARNLVFSREAVRTGREALTSGAAIITDTNMAAAGISKPFAARFGNEIVCKMAEETIAVLAKERRATRAQVAMEWAVEHYPNAIFVVGNAPTALLRLCELMDAGKAKPSFVVGAPVGFVNVIESKEALMSRNMTPYIVARGRKGGSNVAAAIINALYYGIDA